MNPIEIKIKALKGFEIKNFVGAFPEVSIELYDIDGSVQKALATVQTLHGGSFIPKTKSPKEKAEEVKKILEKNFNH